MIVVGVDPGSIATGYAFLENRSGTLKVLEFGALRCKETWSLSRRLMYIHQGLFDLFKNYAPQAMALESSFFSKFPRSVLVLGHARGAIMVAAERLGIEVAEYAPRLVKQAATGRGAASKEQVALMIKSHLKLRQTPEPIDASDALAVAYCHILRVGIAPGKQGNRQVQSAEFSDLNMLIKSESRMSHSAPLKKVRKAKKDQAKAWLQVAASRGIR